jgi:hypothetical protein
MIGLESFFIEWNKLQLKNAVMLSNISAFVGMHFTQNRARLGMLKLFYQQLNQGQHIYGQHDVKIRWRQTIR